MDDSPSPTTPSVYLTAEESPITSDDSSSTMRGRKIIAASTKLGVYRAEPPSKPVEAANDETATQPARTRKRKLEDGPESEVAAAIAGKVKAGAKRRRKQEAARAKTDTTSARATKVDGEEEAATKSRRLQQPKTKAGAVDAATPESKAQNGGPLKTAEETEPEPKRRRTRRIKGPPNLNPPAKTSSEQPTKEELNKRRTAGHIAAEAKRALAAATAEGKAERKAVFVVGKKLGEQRRRVEVEGILDEGKARKAGANAGTSKGNRASRPGGRERKIARDPAAVKKSGRKARTADQEAGAQGEDRVEDKKEEKETVPKKLKAARKTKTESTAEPKSARGTGRGGKRVSEAATEGGDKAAGEVAEIEGKVAADVNASLETTKERKSQRKVRGEPKKAKAKEGKADASTEASAKAIVKRLRPGRRDRLRAKMKRALRLRQSAGGKAAEVSMDVDVDEGGVTLPPVNVVLPTTAHNDTHPTKTIAMATSTTVKTPSAEAANTSKVRRVGKRVELSVPVAETCAKESKVRRKDVAEQKNGRKPEKVERTGRGGRVTVVID